MGFLFVFPRNRTKTERIQCYGLKRFSVFTYFHTEWSGLFSNRIFSNKTMLKVKTKRVIGVQGIQ